jgi:branched-chain amino acid transport system substrate-binding protein
MARRFLSLASNLLGTVLFAYGAFAASADDAPGVTDTEIKFGQTMPYSGPLSSYGVIGRAEAAYFKMINDAGGINGRKLNFISLDDAYSAPKTVEQTRRLVEEERVAFLFGSLGGVTNIAVMPYLNENKIPQLFSAGGADMFTDFVKYPWSIGFNAANVTEARIIVKQILATKPDARIAVLYQDDQLGKNFLNGFHDGLGAEHAGMLVKEESYKPSDPTVDSQIASLQASGADTLIIIATPKAASQAIRKTYDLGWSPDRYLFSGASTIAGTLKPAGLEKSKGILSAIYVKDFADPRWKDDPGFKEYSAFADKYLSSTDRAANAAVYGYGAAILMVHVLKQCGEDLSRGNIMRQALSIKDFTLPIMLPGAKINTSPENRYPMRQMQLERFNGENWEMIGDLLSE